MTLENLLSQVGMGTKLTDRHSGEYVAPVQDQHIYYSYEPPQPSYGHGASKHSYGGSGLKSNASMSALTLLAFLFFLHILQQCIKEHMNEMATAPVVVMSASRETEDVLSKTAKVDKSGEDLKTGYEKKNPFEKSDVDNKMTRISAPEHAPKVHKMFGQNHNKNNEDESSFPGFVSAMNDEQFNFK